MEVDKFNISDIAYVADDRAVKRVVALIVANRDRDSKQQQHKEESRVSGVNYYYKFLFLSRFICSALIV